jgi:hypothetical protein
VSWIAYYLHMHQLFVESASGAVAALSPWFGLHTICTDNPGVCRVCVCGYCCWWTPSPRVETVLVGATFVRGMEFNLEFRLGHCYHEFRGRPSFCVPAPVILTGLRLDSVIVCRVRSLHGLSAVVCRGGALSDRLFATTAWWNLFGPLVVCVSCMAVSARGALGTLCVSQSTALA